MKLTPYKAWDKVKKEITEVSSINFREECIKNKKYATKKFEDIELLPPTGLKDIKENESYLGDILKENKDSREYGIVTKERNNNNLYIEWWYKGIWNKKVYWGFHKQPLSLIKECEIVGNIYTDPDMIKKEP